MKRHKISGGVGGELPPRGIGISHSQGMRMDPCLFKCTQSASQIFISLSRREVPCTCTTILAGQESTSISISICCPSTKIFRNFFVKKSLEWSATKFMLHQLVSLTLSFVAYSIIVSFEHYSFFEFIVT